MLIEYTTTQVTNYIVKIQKMTDNINMAINEITSINNKLKKTKKQITRINTLNKNINKLNERREAVNQKYISVITTEKYLNKKRIHDIKERDAERLRNMKPEVMDKSATDIQKLFKRFQAMKKLPKIKEEAKISKAKTVINKSLTRLVTLKRE